MLLHHNRVGNNWKGFRYIMFKIIQISKRCLNAIDFIKQNRLRTSTEDIVPSKSFSKSINKTTWNQNPNPAQTLSKTWCGRTSATSLSQSLSAADRKLSDIIYIL